MVHVLELRPGKILELFNLLLKCQECQRLFKENDRLLLWSSTHMQNINPLPPLIFEMMQIHHFEVPLV